MPSHSREKNIEQRAEEIEATKAKITKATSSLTELSQQLAFARRQLAFQQKVAVLTRSRIKGQLDSTEARVQERRQVAKAAEIMATSNENQERTARLQLALQDELNRRKRSANLRLEEMELEVRRIDLDVAQRQDLLRRRKEAAAACEALVDEREATSETDLARASRAGRREDQAKRRHFCALLAMADRGSLALPASRPYHHV